MLAGALTEVDRLSRWADLLTNLFIFDKVINVFDKCKCLTAQRFFLNLLARALL
jgi:hypothetical protein